MLNSGLTAGIVRPIQGIVMTVRLVLLGTASLALAAPAFAQQLPPPPGVGDAQGNVYAGPMPDQRPEWRGAPPPMAHPAGHPPMRHGQQVQYPPQWEQARANWLSECRRRHGSGNMVGGAVLGGVVGGVIGNRVAGTGNRVVGTVAGATLGAVAGGAIGDAADKRSARDWCETYLEQNMTWSQGYGQGVVGYGYAPMTVMVPVAYVAVQAPAQPRECKETIVTEEWVTVPQKSRYIPARPRPRPDKRIKLVPDKRVQVN